MPKFRVPVRVSVAPVQTYQRTVVIEAASRKEAAKVIGDTIGAIIERPGWKAINGRLWSILPNETIYETYLDEDGLDNWANADLGNA